MVGRVWVEKMQASWWTKRLGGAVLSATGKTAGSAVRDQDERGIKKSRLFLDGF